MSELHELLAVEDSLKKTSNKLAKETISTLGKDTLFKGAVRDLEMFDSNQAHLNTHEEQELTTTVDENIDYILPHIAKHWDCVLQKDATNQLAMSSVLIDGNVELTKDLPATFLLGLEGKLAEFRKVIEAIPTLAPGIKWIPDPNTKKGAFVTEVPQETFKSEKQMDYRIVVEPTQYHPAEIREVSTNPNIGKYTITTWSGMITPADKADRLNRLDKTLQAVKRARQRANKANVTKQTVAMDLLKYICYGDIPDNK
jgi:hypothetical protein